MKLAVVATDVLKEELLASKPEVEVKFAWLKAISELIDHPDADAVIDLAFENKKEEIIALNGFLPKPVIVNSVIKTIGEINLPFIRLNAWPTFLKRDIAEVATNNKQNKNAVEIIFSFLRKKTEWVPDIVGFISPRVVAMIINEAYFTLEENVSTKGEIDTAMKLGTNYPYGPFEWGQKIGLKNILDLLNNLSIKEKRYKPAPLLIKDVFENK
jgi:3-hydroxybutyryl-CoA dehydrogenase